MKPFDINLDRKILTVTFYEDGYYRIHDSGSLLGTLIPEVIKLGVQWTTRLHIAPDYVKQIRELPEEHSL